MSILNRLWGNKMSEEYVDEEHLDEDVETEEDSAIEEEKDLEKHYDAPSKQRIMFNANVNGFKRGEVVIADVKQFEGLINQGLAEVVDDLL